MVIDTFGVVTLGPVVPGSRLAEHEVRKVHLYLMTSQNFLRTDQPGCDNLSHLELPGSCHVCKLSEKQLGLNHGTKH